MYMNLKKSLKKSIRSKKIKQKGRGATISKSKNKKPDYVTKLEKFIQENPDTAPLLKNYFPDELDIKNTNKKSIRPSSVPPKVKYYTIQYSPSDIANQNANIIERGESPFRPIDPVETIHILKKRNNKTKKNIVK